VEKDIQNLVNELNMEGVQFENKTILVTGGAGFLGSWICDVLIKLGGKILCIDNLSSGRKENIEHLFSKNNFEFIIHDISEPIFFNESIDMIFHFASRASPLEFARHPIQILKANTLGSWVSLGIASKHKARYILASTSEVYGDPDPKNIPTPESYYGYVNPVGSRSCYDEAKRAAEAYVSAYRVQHGIDTRIIRIHNTYGPRMRSGDVYGRVVTRFLDQAIRGVPLTVFGDGHQTRSFTYVTDMVNGIIKTGYLAELSGEVINLGSNREMKIIDLAEKVLEISKSSSKIKYYPLPPDDPRRRSPNTAKANLLLNWKTKIELEKGLKKTLSWMEKVINGKK